MFKRTKSRVFNPLNNSDSGESSNDSKALSINNSERDKSREEAMNLLTASYLKHRQLSKEINGSNLGYSHAMFHIKTQPKIVLDKVASDSNAMKRGGQYCVDDGEISSFQSGLKNNSQIRVSKLSSEKLVIQNDIYSSSQISSHNSFDKSSSISIVHSNSSGNQLRISQKRKHKSVRRKVEEAKHIPLNRLNLSP